MIYYFTGTGNSEFAAKRIAGKTGMPTPHRVRLDKGRLV